MDLSYQTLTSATTREKLHELPQSAEMLPSSDDAIPEDTIEFDAIGSPDDSGISVQMVVNNIIEPGPAANQAEELKLNGIAEQRDLA